ncbi:MAG: metallopeptidase TldD-related protein [Candidatus Aenigmatarchaeota archaeon]
MIEKIARIFKNVDDWIIIYEKQKVKQIKFANSKIVINQFWDFEVLTLFLAKGKKTFLSSLTISSEKDANTFARNCLKKVKNVEENKNYFGIAEGKFNYRSPIYDKKVFEYDWNERIEKVLDDLKQKSAGTFWEGKIEREILTSKRINEKDINTFFNFSIRTFGKTSFHSAKYSTFGKNIEIEKIAEEAKHYSNLTDRKMNVKEKKYPILFLPLALSGILSYASLAFSALEVISGNSFLINKIGKEISSKNLTLIDDGTFRKFDDEGRPTKRTILIDNGILKSYLHNTSTSKQTNQKPTGNAGIVYPVPWEIEVKNGEYSFEEMLENIKEGLIVSNTWYTRFTSFVEGSFSSLARDAIFYVKNGKIEGIAKNVRINSNFLDFLKNIEAIEKRKEEVKWWESIIPVKTPAILIKNILVTRP